MYKLCKIRQVKIICTDRESGRGKLWNNWVMIFGIFSPLFFKDLTCFMYCTYSKMGKKEYIKDIFSLLLNFYLVNEIQVLAGGIGWFGSWHLRDGWCWLENAIIMTPLVAKNASLYKLSFRSISPLLLSPLRLNQKNLRDGNN